MNRVWIGHASPRMTTAVARLRTNASEIIRSAAFAVLLRDGSNRAPRFDCACARWSCSRHSGHTFARPPLRPPVQLQHVPRRSPNCAVDVITSSTSCSTSQLASPRNSGGWFRPSNHRTGTLRRRRPTRPQTSSYGHRFARSRMASGFAGRAEERASSHQSGSQAIARLT